MRHHSGGTGHLEAQADMREAGRRLDRMLIVLKSVRGLKNPEQIRKSLLQLSKHEAANRLYNFLTALNYINDVGDLK